MSTVKIKPPKKKKGKKAKKEHVYRPRIVEEAVILSNMRLISSRHSLKAIMKVVRLNKWRVQRAGVRASSQDDSRQTTTFHHSLLFSAGNQSCQSQTFLRKCAMFTRLAFISTIHG